MVDEVGSVPRAATVLCYAVLAFAYKRGARVCVTECSGVVVALMVGRWLVMSVWKRWGAAAPLVARRRRSDRRYGRTAHGSAQLGD